jgi:ELMO/CED-12 family
MVKRLRRAVTGQSAVERICSGDPSSTSASDSSYPMSLQFYHEWSTSRQLAPTFAAYASRIDMDIAAVAGQILGVKDERARSHSLLGLRSHSLSADPDASDSDPAHTTVRDNLKLCLTAIRDVNAAKSAISALCSTPYDADSRAHRTMLEELWALLRPGVKRIDEANGSAQISKQWGDVGFQQRDPASDFRGGGLLGLKQLVHIARLRGVAARNMLVTPAAEEARYPWACAGINVTMTAISALGAGKLDAILLGAAENGLDVVNVYHGVYCDLFEKLHTRWIAAKPENVLAFGPVFDAAMMDALGNIADQGRVVSTDGSGHVSGNKSE